MSTKLDWDRAHENPARVLSWKERRLDRAADNWIANGSLNRNPPPKKTQRAGPITKRESKPGDRQSGAREGQAVFFAVEGGQEGPSGGRWSATLPACLSSRPTPV
jgi:hypothetical protein